MSEQKKLINEEIKLNSTGRDYYTGSNYAYYPDEEVSEFYEVDQVTPAGISGEPRPATTQEEAVRFIEETPEGTKSETPVIYERTPIIAPKEFIKEEVYEEEGMTTDEANSSFVRFYSLIPDNNTVSISVGGKPVFRDVPYEGETKFIGINSGINEISFYDSKTLKLLYEYKLDLPTGSSTTLVIVKNGDNYSVFELNSSAPACFYNTAFIRFIQTVPNAPAMDIYVDQIAVILGIMFNEVSAFFGISSGVHNIKITAAATAVMFADESFNFTPNSLNNVFIVSDNAGGYKLSLYTNENGCI